MSDMPKSIAKPPDRSLSSAMTSALIVLSTASKREEAEKIAKALVEEKLAACVNLIPQMESRYGWKGKIETGSEVLMIIKTLRPQFKKLSKRLHELHSYEVPEILALPVTLGSPAYLSWMEKSLKKSGR